jgi:hypothetical protein
LGIKGAASGGGGGKEAATAREAADAKELKGLRRQLNKRERAASPADDDEDAT